MRQEGTAPPGSWRKSQIRPEAAERGKRAFIWSLIATVGAALAITLVDNVFGAVS